MLFDVDSLPLTNLSRKAAVQFRLEDYCTCYDITQRRSQYIRKLFSWICLSSLAKEIQDTLNIDEWLYLRLYKIFIALNCCSGYLCYLWNCVKIHNIWRLCNVWVCHMYRYIRYEYFEYGLASWEVYNMVIKKNYFRTWTRTLA